MKLRNLTTTRHPFRVIPCDEKATTCPLFPFSYRSDRLLALADIFQHVLYLIISFQVAFLLLLSLLATVLEASNWVFRCRPVLGG
jgi:hypothetical protein